MVNLQIAINEMRDHATPHVVFSTAVVIPTTAAQRSSDAAESKIEQASESNECATNGMIS